MGIDNRALSQDILDKCGEAEVNRMVSMILKIVIYFIIPAAVSVFAIANTISIMLSVDLTVDLSPNGFIRFIDIFKVPLQSLTILLGYATFLLAWRRIELMAQQLEMLHVNNRLTNFFKHRDAFLTHMEASKVCQIIRGTSAIDYQQFLAGLYGDFYCSNYTTFKPVFNNNMNEFLRCFRIYLIQVDDVQIKTEYDRLFGDLCLNSKDVAIPEFLGWVELIVQEWGKFPFVRTNTAVLKKALYAEIIVAVSIFNGVGVDPVLRVYNFSGFLVTPESFHDSSEKAIASFFYRNSLMAGTIDRKGVNPPSSGDTV